MFKVPQGDNEWSSNWRKCIINVVTKNRVIDKVLRERIMKTKNIFFCERDYSEDQLVICIYKIIRETGKLPIDKKAVSTLIFFIRTTSQEHEPNFVKTLKTCNFKDIF